MFVGIVGPTCSGKHEVMEILASAYGFTRLYLRSPSSNGHISNIGNIDGDMRSSSSSSSEDRAGNEFDTVEEILDHVTLNWMQRFVTCDVRSVHGISILRKRPFFLLLSVESPMMIRYRRCVSRCQTRGLAPPTLEDFVEFSDASLYTVPTIASTTTTATIAPAITTTAAAAATAASPSVMSSSVLSIQSNESEQNQEQEPIPETRAVTSLQPDKLDHSSPPSLSSFAKHYVHNYPPYKLLSMSDLSLLNTHTDLHQLRQDIDHLDITNPDLLRPSWDSYFMYLANLAARRSNCMKRRVGCVLVRERRVIATGYNGTPKNLMNCNDGGCSRCNQGTPCGKGLDRCLCMHAEENALLEAGRERVGSGSTIYCNTCPCLGCAIKIVQVGVSQVVYSESYGMDDLTAEVFRKAGVELRQHATPGIKLDQSSP